MDKVIIIGGKGTAINIAEQIVNATETYNAKIEFLGFAIDDESLGRSINGYPVLCKTTELGRKYSQLDVKFIFALYKPQEMKKRVALLKSYGIDEKRFASFIHPSAYIGKSARLGVGNVVLSHTSIQSNVRIGNFNIINSGVAIEHDSSMKDCNFIAAGVCVGANVRINDGAFIGLNSTVREDVNIGDFAFVGMGSNVLRDVHAETTVFGNPARSAS
ncbi:MAG: NeuD/PglB/VioB family sugar acetyltransferase [Pseudomonadota bacterium]